MALLMKMLFRGVPSRLLSHVESLFRRSYPAVIPSAITANGIARHQYGWWETDDEHVITSDLSDLFRYRIAQSHPHARASQDMYP
jgi:hypothetical protein